MRVDYVGFVTAIYYTYPFGWLGDTDRLAHAWSDPGAWSRIRLTGPVDPYPLTMESS